MDLVQLVQYDKLAIEADQHIYTPVAIPSLNALFSNTKISGISTGGVHSLFLAASGQVYSCGGNNYGQCGFDASIESLSEPQAVPRLVDIMQISSGHRFNLCLDKNGAVWGFGRNASGQLGLGPDFREWQVCNPRINPYFTGDKDENRIAFIKCGFDFSMCMNERGKVFMCGSNSNGECGSGEKSSAFGGIKTPYCIQSTVGLEKIFFVSGDCGESHTVLLSKDNDLYGFGGNSYNQSGNSLCKPVKIERKDIGIEEMEVIVRVICGRYSTVLVIEE